MSEDNFKFTNILLTYLKKQTNTTFVFEDAIRVFSSIIQVKSDQLEIPLHKMMKTSIKQGVISKYGK